MRYNQIRSMDIANGEGIRTSLFVQGCSFHCKGCFNTETWNFLGGKEWTEELEETFLNLNAPHYIYGTTILGGEPLHPTNLKDVTKLMAKFKKRFPQKTIWVYTGYTEKTMSKEQIDSLNKYVDVVVVGQFVEELKDLTLRFRGSSNQKIINLNKAKLTKEE